MAAHLAVGITKNRISSYYTGKAQRRTCLNQSTNLKTRSLFAVWGSGPGGGNGPLVGVWAGGFPYCCRSRWSPNSAGALVVLCVWGWVLKCVVDHSQQQLG